MRKRTSSSVGPTYPKLKPKNDEQKECIQTIENNIITFIYGLSGSGKTHLTAGVAARHLNNKWVNKIILSRAAVGSEDIGYLPGNSVEKINGYLCPILTELNYFLDVKNCIKNGLIEIQPLLSMRGLTFKNSFVIIEEIQNLNPHQLKMILTRLGENTKIVFTGDISQSDLNTRSLEDLNTALSKIDKICNEENKIAIFELFESVRHPLIKVILEALEND